MGKNVKQMVINALEQDDRARNNKRIVYHLVWKQQDPFYHEHFVEFLAKTAILPESIERALRAVQNAPDSKYAPDKHVLKKRGQEYVDATATQGRSIYE